MSEGVTRLQDELQRVLDDLDCEYDSLVEDEDNRFVVSKYRRSNGEFVLLKRLKKPDPYLQLLLLRESLAMKAIPKTAHCRTPKVYSHGADYILREFVDGQSVGIDVDLNDADSEKLAAGLAEFQAMSTETCDPELADRDGLRLYYLKRFAKHAIHLLPDYISLGVAVKILWKLWRALPEITAFSVPSHGDLRLSNLLFSDDGIVLVDLEGFRIRNHPLYDVVSLMSADIRPFHQWTWQLKFIKHYVSLTSEVGWKRPEQLQKLVWTLLLFFSIYRFNECRMHANSTCYYNGGSKVRFVIGRLIQSIRFSRKPPLPSKNVAITEGNLMRILDRHHGSLIVQSLICGNNIPE